MVAEEQAKEYLERFENGERSRQLLEKLDQAADEVSDDDLQIELVEAIYRFLDDEPHVFVSDSRGFFDDIVATGGELNPETLTTFSVLAENPPKEFTNHVNDLLILLTRDRDLQRGLAARMLYHLAIDYPERVEPAKHGLRSILHDPNPQIRGSACLALGYLHATDAVSDIKLLLTDDSAYVREAAQWARSRISHKKTGPDPVGTWSKADFEPLSPREFEQLVSDLWTAMGYRTTVTDPGPDGGIDVVATNGEEHVAIQAKRYLEGTVGGPTAQQVGGLAARDDFDRAVLVTTSSFTAPAESYSEVVNAIELIDGTMLCELLELNEIGPTEYQ